jgi:DNA-binding MarR family transcriptional regulator
LATEAPAAFFSYSSDDSEFALRLAGDLKAAGAAVWLDKLDIKPSQHWNRAVEEALTNCPCMLVILSPSSVDSENVLDEVDLALDKRKTIIPVLYRDCETPLRLRRVQHIDFRNDYGRGLQALLKALGEQPPPQPVTPAPFKESLSGVPVADEQKGAADHALPEPKREQKLEGVPGGPLPEPLGEKEIGEKEIRILKELRDGPRVSRNRHSVAKMTDIEYREVVRLVSKLARMGLVAPEEVPGERRRLWFITNKGRVWVKEEAPSRPLRKVRIFLASSSELREDRDAFDLYFRQENDSLVKIGVYLAIVRWENFLDAMSETRLQDEYNKEIRACDVFVSLFFTKTGKFTEEEFDAAHAQFKKSGRPLIYTYFKNADIKIGSARKDDLNSRWAFQEKVEKLGHFYSEYDNVPDLKLKFRGQIEKILEKLKG